MICQSKNILIEFLVGKNLVFRIMGFSFSGASVIDQVLAQAAPRPSKLQIAVLSPGFGLPPEGGSMVFPLLRQSARGSEEIITGASTCS